MKEQSKATNRRLQEKDFNWHKIFKGACIDLGPGDDGINMAQWPKLKSVKLFDVDQGDCNAIDSYFEPNTFSVVHGSQVAEHTNNPKDFIRRCLKICKKGGHVVVSIPDWVTYEKMNWPSLWNLDHKSSWSMLYRGSIAPIHIYIPDFLKSFEDQAEIILARFIDTNYNYSLGCNVDQTFKYEDGVECFNEFCIRKK